MPVEASIGRLLTAQEREVWPGGGVLRSGFVIDAGWVLTAWHCLRDIGGVQARLWLRLQPRDGTEPFVEVPVRYAAHDVALDVALLAVDGEYGFLSGVALPLGGEVRAGAAVRIGGFPERNNARHAVVFNGVVESADALVGRHLGVRVHVPAFAARYAESPGGMSGGPLLREGADLRDQVVGVVVSYPRFGDDRGATGGGVICRRIADVCDRFSQIGAPTSGEPAPLAAWVDDDRTAPLSVHSFAGGLHRLIPDYLDPGELRAMTVDQSFRPREWLVAEIDDFVAAHDRGYFFIEADAGAGKSAFALWYSGRGAVPCHFTQLGGEARRSEAAARNLAVQLIAACGLDDLARGGLPERSGALGWLRVVLTAAARRRAEAGDRHPIIIVVDGLDELVDPARDGLPLGLPPVLPERVYVVATARTGAITYEPPSAFVVCSWHARRDQDLGDRRAFLHDMVGEQWLADRVHEDGGDAADLVLALLDRCEDNWLYLRCVLDEIRIGARRPHEVRRLPRGLAVYYTINVDRLRGDGPDEGWRTAVLATLAIAAEPMDADVLAAVAGGPAPHRVEGFLYGALWPFCTRWPASRPDGRERFALKHATFREYLVGDPGLPEEGRSSAALATQHRLAAECHRAAQRICDRYLHAWGGLEACLPLLAENLALAEVDDGYGLRQLARHLDEVGRIDELHQILRCEAGDRNLWWLAHERTGEISGFLTDVARAQAAAEDRGQREDVALRIRYALIEASVASAASRLPAELIGQLVDRGEWTATRAFSAIERTADQPTQLRTLVRVVASIPEAAMPRALSMVLACRDPDLRADALRALIKRLPDALLEDAADAVSQLDGQARLPPALRALLERLPDERLGLVGRRVLPRLRGSDRAGAGALLALRRAGPHAADTAVADIGCIENKFERCQWLAAAAAAVPPVAFGRFVAVMLGCPADYRTEPLVAFAVHCPTSQLATLLAAAAEPGWEGPFKDTPEPTPCRRFMEAVGRRLPEHLVPTAVAFALARPHFHAGDAVEALARCATIDEGLVRATLSTLRSDWHWRYAQKGRTRLYAVAALAGLLPDVDEGRRVVLAEVDDLVRGLGRPILDADLAFTVSEADMNVYDVPDIVPVGQFLPYESVGFLLRVMAQGRSSWLAELARLAPATVDGHGPEVFGIVRRLAARYPMWPQTVVDTLAPWLSNARLRQALELLAERPVEPEWFGAMAAMCGQSSATTRRDLAQRVIAAAANPSFSGIPARAVTPLAPILPLDLTPTAFGVLAKHPEWPYVVPALDAYAPTLPETLLTDALDMFARVWLDAEDLAQAAVLLTRLGKDAHRIRPHLLSFYRPGHWAHSSSLWSLAPHLSPAVALDVLDVARTLPDAPWLPEDALPDRTRSMAALAPRLPEQERSDVVREVLTSLSNRRAGFADRASVLARLADAAPADDAVAQSCRALLAEAFADGVEHRDWTALLDLLAHLPPGCAESVLQGTASWQARARCDIAAALAPRLTQELLASTAASVMSTECWSGAEQGARARALVALARHAGDLVQQDHLLATVLDRAASHGGWQTYSGIFLELIPLLSGQQRWRAVDAALNCIIGTGQYFRDKDVHDLDRVIDVLSHESDFLTAVDVIGRIADPGLRARATASVLRRAGTLPGPSATLLGRELLELWPSGIGRADLLALVGASAWWIRRRGGEGCMTEVAGSLADIVRWWR